MVWRGDAAFPEAEPDMKILGTPLGHPKYVQSFLRATNEAHGVLMNTIPAVFDLQSAPHQTRGDGEGQAPPSPPSLPPPIAAATVDAMDNDHAREHLVEARFDVPGWEDLANGLRPDDEDSVGVPRHGWQGKATRPVNERFLEGFVQPRLLDASRALLRSQSGPLPVCPSPAFLPAAVPRALVGSPLASSAAQRALWSPPQRGSAGKQVAA